VSLPPLASRLFFFFLKSTSLLSINITPWFYYVDITKNILNLIKKICAHSCCILNSHLSRFFIILSRFCESVYYEWSQIIIPKLNMVKNKNSKIQCKIVCG
jgi:hypothetical protein